MLHVLVGSNLKKELAAITKGTSVVRLESERYSKEQLLSLAHSADLFGERAVVVLAYQLDEPQLRDDILSIADELQASARTFVALATKLDAASIQVFGKRAERLVKASAAKKEWQGSGAFALADALGERNKKKAWVELERARRAGSEPEALHGMLMWITRAMVLAQEARSAKEAGLTPFVFSKASRFSKKWSEEELKKCVRRLVVLYHDSRRGRHELDVALERFVLSL